MKRKKINKYETERVVFKELNEVASPGSFELKDYGWLSASELFYNKRLYNKKRILYLGSLDQSIEIIKCFIAPNPLKTRKVIVASGEQALSWTLQNNTGIEKIINSWSEFDLSYMKPSKEIMPISDTVLYFSKLGYSEAHFNVLKRECGDWIKESNFLIVLGYGLPFDDDLYKTIQAGSNCLFIADNIRGQIDGLDVSDFIGGIDVSIIEDVSNHSAVIRDLLQDKRIIKIKEHIGGAVHKAPSRGNGVASFIKSFIPSANVNMELEYEDKSIMSKRELEEYTRDKGKMLLYEREGPQLSLFSLETPQ